MMKNGFVLMKKLTAGALAVGMVVTGIAVISQQAEAESDVTIRNAVIYDESYDIADYWNNNKKAPVKDGYVFGGWFKEDANTTAENRETLTSEDGTTTKTCVPLTSQTIDANDDKMVDEDVTAIAKFVPAHVLSVKAQNGVAPGGTEIKQASDISESNPMWVRVMTSQDSENYNAIGFDIRLANKKEPIDNADGDKILETNKVFNQVYVGETLTDAEDIFGENSHYVCVWKLDQINYSGNADKIIYVRPYWYTKDGTKVLGLAKYVHIEDDYLDYISVPINIHSAEEIAAGIVNMSYDFNGLELISDDKDKYFEEGRLFTEMGVNYDNTNKRFTMVGNAVNVNEWNSEETIYANLRFKKPTTDTTLNFDMILGDFCNWAEDISVTEKVKVWDIAYEVKATTNE